MNSVKDRSDLFQQWLNQMSRDRQLDAQRKREQGDEFEAVLDRIRANIAGLYARLFALSCDPNELPLRNAELRSIVERAESDEQRIREAFTFFLRIVSEHWVTTMELAARHGDVENELKERVKIETMERIRGRFAELFPEVRR